MIKKIVFYLLIFTIFILCCGEASASCNVSITSINFGSYDVFAASPTDSVGTITISCTDGPPGVFANVSIGISMNSGILNPRRMKRAGGTDVLDYNLFTTSTRATIWGDGTSGTSTMTTASRVRSGRPATMNVYGRIPAGRNVSVGSYSDTLVVTVTP
jgi:spore coat protein U-like protein